MIPDFSIAICLKLSPKYSVWSRDIEVIIDIAGFSITLVASNLPPSPTSNIIRSASTLLKLRKAAAVVPSKKVGLIPIFSHAILHSSHI